MRQTFDRVRPGWLWLCIVWVSLVLSASGDQVDMQNGDRYIGKVLSLDKETLVLQNEVLGVLRLPRAKVALISLGSTLGGSTASPTAKNQSGIDKARTNAVADPTGIAAKLNANSNVIDQVAKKFLSGAGPEAQDKFDQLVSGLLSGKLTVEDVRAQARAAADQARAARKELGDSAGWALDGYLAILDQFLGESPAPARTGTNSPAPNIKSADLLGD